MPHGELKHVARYERACVERALGDPEEVLGAWKGRFERTGNGLLVFTDRQVILVKKAHPGDPLPSEYPQAYGWSEIAGLSETDGYIHLREASGAALEGFRFKSRRKGQDALALFDGLLSANSSSQDGPSG
jgi:hypothetical protein